MNPFPQLSDTDIDDILSFIKNPPSHHKEKLSVEKTYEPSETLIRLVILGFSVLSVILLLLLLRRYTLVRIIDEESHDRKKKI